MYDKCNHYYYYCQYMNMVYEKHLENSKEMKWKWMEKNIDTVHFKIKYNRHRDLVWNVWYVDIIHHEYDMNSLLSNNPIIKRR